LISHKRDPSGRRAKDGWKVVEGQVKDVNSSLNNVSIHILYTETQLIEYGNENTKDEGCKLTVLKAMKSVERVEGTCLYLHIHIHHNIYQAIKHHPLHMDRG
jgi:hypothetical protein